MKIIPYSDLHLEFGSSFNLKTPSEPTVLVLAGDVAPWEKHWNLINNFLFHNSHKFQRVIFVPGNHEYYGGDLEDSATQMREFIKKTFANVTFLDDDYTLVKDVVFIGSTLWTSLNERAPDVVWEALAWMNDFKYITVGGERLNPDFWYLQNQSAMGFLTNTLTHFRKKKVVVITHHAPSFQSVHEKHQGMKLNWAYANNLDYFIANHQPALWIHGHTHYSFDYMIDNTRVICNPYGYHYDSVNESFNENLVVKI